MTKKQEEIIAGLYRLPFKEQVKRTLKELFPRVLADHKIIYLKIAYEQKKDTEISFWENALHALQSSSLFEGHKIRSVKEISKIDELVEEKLELSDRIKMLKAEKEDQALLNAHLDATVKDLAMQRDFLATENAMYKELQNKCQCRPQPPQELADLMEQENLILTVRELTDLPSNERYCVYFEDAEFRHGHEMLVGACGRGDNIREAVRRYCQEISGKLLIRDSMRSSRREIKLRTVEANKPITATMEVRL